MKEDYLEYLSIKPLEWTETDAKSYWLAHTAFGNYTIYYTGVGYNIYLNATWGMDYNNLIYLSFQDTLDEAKYSAQTDFFKRIKSCIKYDNPNETNC